MLVKTHIYISPFRDFPSHMQCPSVVYGVGLSKRMAIDAARVYANARGTGCGQYSGHCQVKKFIK